jgi:hypothetical protein
MQHIDALKLRLSNERSALAAAKTDGERQLRKVWISQIEKEIAGEQKFLAGEKLTDDELLAELTK